MNAEAGFLQRLAQAVVVAITHGKHHGIEAAKLFGLVRDHILVGNAIGIELAHASVGNLLNAVLGEMMHQELAMLRDHVDAHGLAELGDGDVMLKLAQKLGGLATDHAAADDKHLLARLTLSGQKVAAMDDGGIVNALNRKNERVGARGNNNLVGLLLTHEIDVDFLVEDDFNACLLSTDDVSANHVGDVALSGREGGQAHVAAQGLLGFVQSHAVTALGCDESGSQTGDAAADDHNLLLDVGSRFAVNFMPQEGVDQAAQGLALVHVGRAALQAGDARKNVIQAILLRALGHMRIGQGLTTEGDQVGTTLLNHELGVLRLGEAADGDGGDMDGTLDFGEQVGAEPAVNRGGSPHELVLDVHRAGDMQALDAAILEVACDCRGILNGKTAQNLIGGVDARDDGDLAAHALLHFLDDEAREAHTVLEGAAELVEALVGARAHEGAYQIAVSHMDLDGVDAALHGALGSVAVALDQLVDLLGGDFLGNVATVSCLDGAGSLNGGAGVLGVALGAGVLQLNAHAGAVLMGGVGDALEAGDARVVVEAGLQRAALGALVDDRCLDGDKAEAALGALGIVGHGLIGPGAIGIGEVVAHGGNHETVLHLHGANLDRLEHFLELHKRPSKSNEACASRSTLPSCKGNQGDSQNPRKRGLA